MDSNRFPQGGGYIPSTEYSVSTAYSTIVSNGVTRVTAYPVTETTVVYIPVTTTAAGTGPGKENTFEYIQRQARR
jgi:hypothetical protein